MSACIGTAPQVLGAMNAPSLSRSYDAPVVSFSHFLPRPELMPPRFNVGAMSFLADLTLTLTLTLILTLTLTLTRWAR